MQEPTPQTAAQTPPEEPVPASAGTYAVDAEPSDADESASIWTAATEGTSATNERATVSLAISPWGEVYIDGKHIGVSPPVNEVQVTPGQRVVEIRNGNFPPYTQRIDLKSRQKIKIRYKFN